MPSQSPGNLSKERQTESDGQKDKGQQRSGFGFWSPEHVEGLSERRMEQVSGVYL